MNLMLVVAILAISAVPMYVQAQKPSAVKLRADAQNVVKIISGDKLQTQTYCEIAELSDQIDQEEDPTKAEELSQKRDQLEGKLDPRGVRSSEFAVSLKRRIRPRRAMASNNHASRVVR